MEKQKNWNSFVLDKVYVLGLEVIKLQIGLFIIFSAKYYYYFNF